MALVGAVIDRLEGLDFNVERRNEVDLFGEALPFVRAIAVDRQAHQLVFVAEDLGEIDGDQADLAWTELLFAISGIRHQLRESDASALALPVVVAVVADRPARRLRALVEELVDKYALFARVDLNLLETANVDDESEDAVDRALSSVLPRVRDALKEGRTVAARDVGEFWDELAREVQAAASHLQADFGEDRTRRAVERVQGELRGATEPAHGGSARPMARLQLKNFRSFEDENFVMWPVTIISGANGSGKTSICEAMELLWSGRSNRIPEDVDSATYEEHLKFKGAPFDITSWSSDGVPKQVQRLADEPHISLSRSILPQHALTALADGNPKERFRAFLEASGLQIPEFEVELKSLKREARQDLDAILEKAGLVNVHAANETARRVLGRSFDAHFVTSLPAWQGIRGAAATLVSVSGGAYLVDEFRFEPSLERLPSLLAEVDTAFLRIAEGFDFSIDPGPAIKSAITGLDASVSGLREAELPLRRLIQTLVRVIDDRGTPKPAESPLPLDPKAAIRWIGQVNGLERDAKELAAFRDEIADEVWRGHLDRYLRALEEAVNSSPKTALEALIDQDLSQGPGRAEEPAAQPPEDLLFEAGFEFAPSPSESLIAALGELLARISGEADALSAISRELGRHPGLAFANSADQVATGLCRFELVREIAKPTGALAKARETLVARLLDGRLFPILQELVDSLVRFEWYFEPMTVDVRRNQMRIGGLSTDDPGLDVRMLLNAAERTIVGVAWFLALHVTQATEDREVLMLDDPAGGFDDTNKAAFVSTMRVLVRLLRPRQLVVTTHDQALAGILEEELAPVDGWPEATGVLRCRRNGEGTSTAESVKSMLLTDVVRELDMIPLEPSSVD
jgi:plasmid stabilization system protein ParE